MSELIPEPTPPPISLEELLALKEVIMKKEDSDRLICGQINIPYGALKDKLYDWACKGFPGAYEISRVFLEPPSKCSDGVTRNIYEYIFFLTGKQLDDFIQMIRDQVSGIQITSSIQANNNIVILVTKL